MQWFERYCPSQRTSLHHYHFTQALGLVPLIVVITFMFAEPGGPPPVWWMYLGLGIGSQLLLWGAFALPENPTVKRRWAKWLAERADRWFPWFLFLIQTVYMYLAFIILDLAIVRLGFDFDFADRMKILSLITLVPLRRLHHESETVKRDAQPVLLGRFLTTLTTCLVTAFVADALATMAAPKRPSPSEAISPVILFIWTPAVLIILSSSILFIDRLLHPDRR